MSLLHRAKSTETGTRRPSGLVDDNHGRRMSYNPVGASNESAVEFDPPGASNVPQAWRITQVLIAVIYCLFSAGIIFGYAALKPVLIQEGVYRDRCTKQELQDHVEVCYDQEIRLNLMFTIAAVATNVCALPVGAILDRYGPRFCSLIGCLLIAVGCSLLAFAQDLHPTDAYIPGYLFLALGGPFVFISTFQLSNTFTRNSGLILSMVTGAFDTSSAIFLLYRLMYQRSAGAFAPKKFFLVYLIIPVLIAAAQLTIMPSKSYKTASELASHTADVIRNGNGRPSEEPAPRADSPNESSRLLGDDGNRISGHATATGESDSEERKRAISGIWGALHGRTATQQLSTPWFALITLFTMMQMLRINYFVATVRPQYTYLLDSSHAATAINNAFDIALPLGGIIAIPFIGFILDNTSTPFVLALLVGLAIVIGALGVLPYTWAAYTNVVLFVLYRPFFYTTVSDYAAKVFGFITFGTVYGLIICLAGLFNFLQTPLDKATHQRFCKDPRPVNLIFLVVGGIIGMMLVAYVWAKSRSMHRGMLEQEAETSDERQALIPGHDERVHEDRHPVKTHANRTPADPRAKTGDGH